MLKFTAGNGLKLITLAIVLLGNITNVRATDCEIFQKAVGDLNKYDKSSDCCLFNGIKCDNNNSIVKIELENFNCPNGKDEFIDEAITEFTNLKSLTSFEIKSPHFCKFPKNLCQLKNLKSLTVNLSFSESEIPECISEITNLEELNFEGSGLKGKIPESIGSLKNLRILNLNDNKLEGYIPYSFKNLENLTELDLKGNSDLTGYIPEMKNIKTCEYLFTSLCKSETTTCTEGLSNKYCTKEQIETSNKNNGNPDPNNFDYKKEVKKHHRTLKTYIPCGFCLFIVIIMLLIDWCYSTAYDSDELLQVTTEKRNQFNHVVNSSTRTMTVKQYLIERRIATAIVAIIGIVLFFVIE